MKHDSAFLVSRGSYVAFQNVIQLQDLLGFEIYSDSTPNTAENEASCDVQQFVGIVGKDGGSTFCNLVREQTEEKGYPLTKLHNLRLHFAAFAYVSGYKAPNLSGETFLEDCRLSSFRKELSVRQK